MKDAVGIGDRAAPVFLDHKCHSATQTPVIESHRVGAMC
jgi:hypothetical protein